jgi:hypothetical protein
MVKAKVFLVCMITLLFVISGVGAYHLYAMERAIARSIYADVLDDMQDIGYLNQALTDYYTNKMARLGWDVSTDVFAGSWPRGEGERARKERKESVTLAMKVTPSNVAKWLNAFVEGDTAFSFTGSRPSEYFDPGW